MIVNFTVGNFLSFKDKKTLSFAASSIKDNPQNIIKHRGKRLLRSIAIYGANSSGKSNLLKAMGRMKDVLMNSVKLNPDEALDYSPFLLSTTTNGQPTFFEIEFFIEKILYRYGFEYNEKEITKEWLFRKKALKGEEDFLFVRKEQEITVNDIFKEGEYKEKTTNKNRLFLSLVAQLGGETSQEILEWFQIFLKVKSGIEHQQYETVTIPMLLDRQEGYKRAIDFYQKLQLGFSNIEIKSIDEMSPEEPKLVLENNKIIVEKTTSKKTINKSFTIHNQYNQDCEIIDKVYFDDDTQESEGTKKILHLSGPLFQSLLSGASIVIDELDAKLHPIITQEIIKLFNSTSENSNNAQLLFATHDTNLLESGLFRRDQIWFTEKDDVEQTDLYSLYDLKLPDGSKVRNDANLEKNYIKGRYGAIPYIK